jgi:hypothetical protein
MIYQRPTCDRILNDHWGNKKLTVTEDELIKNIKRISFTP